jgi:hypothetical protein
LAVAGALAVSVPRAAAQSDQVGEYELKAAILYNLVKFVEWPPSAYPDSHAPTVLCVLGQDPFGEALEMPGKAQNANGRPVSMRRLKNENGIRDCQVLYISTSERKSIPQILSRLKESNVLTVGEMSQFALQGGIIQFTLEDKQVRFEINLDAASRMSLKISSRLLMLAHIVKDRRQNPDAKSDGIPVGSTGTAGVLLLALADSEHQAGAQTFANTLAREPPSLLDARITCKVDCTLIYQTRVSPRSSFSNRSPWNLGHHLGSRAQSSVSKQTI